MRNLMLKAMAWREARRAEEGQTVIEYALVVAAISIVLIGGLLTFGDDIIDAAQAEVDEFAFPGLPD